MQLPAPTIAPSAIVKRKKPYCNLKALVWAALVAPVKTADQRSVLVQMAPHAGVNDWGDIFVSAETMAGRVLFSRRRVSRAWNELEALKLIIDTKKRKGDTGKIIVWRLCRETVLNQHNSIAPDQHNSKVPDQRNSIAPNPTANCADTRGAIVPNATAHITEEVVQEVVHELTPRAREDSAPCEVPEEATPVSEKEVPQPTPDDVAKALAEVGVKAKADDKYIREWLNLGYNIREIVGSANSVDLTKIKNPNAATAYINPVVLRDQPGAAGAGRVAAQKSIARTNVRNAEIRKAADLVPVENKAAELIDKHNLKRTTH
ncbi:MAG: helix-turn-helix domain-containing protein [Usitatibacter sp.]